MSEELKQAERALDRMSGYLPRVYKDDIEIVRRALTAAQPAQAGETEREQLRSAQADAVMPLIGPLLDAWENTARDVMSQEPELSKQLKAINTAMEGAPLPTQPAAQATPESVHYIGAHITEGKLHASVMRRDSGGIVTVVATAEMHAGSLHELDCMSKMKPATTEPVGCVWTQPDHLQKARVAPHLCRVAPTRLAPDFVPLFTHPAPGVPEIDYQALIHAAWGKHKYAQGTGGCIAFKRGAEWFRDIALAAAQAKGGEHG